MVFLVKKGPHKRKRTNKDKLGKTNEQLRSNKDFIGFSYYFFAPRKSLDIITSINSRCMILYTRFFKNKQVKSKGLQNKKKFSYSCRYEQYTVSNTGRTYSTKYAIVVFFIQL